MVWLEYIQPANNSSMTEERLFYSLCGPHGAVGHETITTIIAVQ